MTIPRNEQGVAYLFSRYHEKLGFEKIIKIGTHFPDVIATRNGEKVRIELEFLLSGVRSHYLARVLQDKKYRVLDPTGNEHTITLTWVYDKNIKSWRPTPKSWNNCPEKIEEFFKSIRLNVNNMPPGQKMELLIAWENLKNNLSRRIPDDLGDLYESGEYGKLYYKSLKHICDVVVCWEIDCELNDPDIEIIELKTALHEPNQLRTGR